MFCHITKVGLNVMKILIINALPKLQLLPFCFVGQYLVLIPYLQTVSFTILILLLGQSRDFRCPNTCD